MVGELVLLLFAASAGPSTPTARPLPILYALMPTEACPEGDGDEVVVCGRKGEDERYRLPFRDDPVSPYDRPVGDASRLTRDPFTSGPCGIFAGQRRCDKREAAAHGYGGGRDPVTAADSANHIGYTCMLHLNRSDRPGKVGDIPRRLFGPSGGDRRGAIREMCARLGM